MGHHFLAEEPATGAHQAWLALAVGGDRRPEAYHTPPGGAGDHKVPAELRRDRQGVRGTTRSPDKFRRDREIAAKRTEIAAKRDSSAATARG